MKSVDELSEKLKSVGEESDGREREVQEVRELVKTHEAEVEKLGQRMEELLQEGEEVQERGGWWRKRGRG